MGHGLHGLHGDLLGLGRRLRSRGETGDTERFIVTYIISPRRKVSQLNARFLFFWKETGEDTPTGRGRPESEKQKQKHDGAGTRRRIVERATSPPPLPLSQLSLPTITCTCCRGALPVGTNFWRLSQGQQHTKGKTKTPMSIVMGPQYFSSTQ